MYHKHKRADSYYHEHCICRNVAEAIEQIKNHDKYVLESAEGKKEVHSPTPEQLTRKLNVHEASGYNYSPTPYILLKGQWLKKLGFFSGEQVDVKREKTKLQLKQKAAIKCIDIVPIKEYTIMHREER